MVTTMTLTGAETYVTLDSITEVSMRAAPTGTQLADGNYAYSSE